ncbi:unnamed protein product [Mycena citricolor]|uniref:T6SS Phospholipase effector Tle1-like catalytic domain-containing protein n=1 Tax=Mycena citricolor TaxID=2018698 RepID=A0AAD2JX59_9AGAR|nr:unnamed protein product [Mycena citricolor]
MAHTRSETDETAINSPPATLRSPPPNLPTMSGLQQTTSSPLNSPTSTMPINTNPPLPGVIPPEHPYRTLVLCFDGTGDQFDADNSNIIQFFTLLPKADRTRQMVYYQAGIGTYTTPQIATPMMSKFSKILDEMIAWNLDAHVMGGYEFLMQNYTANDRICIFGFSRGAYTARSLAGMLHKVGLLPACNHQQIPFAYKMFTRADEIGWKQSNLFKKAFSIDVDIEFIGVWDTVNSVGLIPKRLPFTTSNTIVRTFRHALSLDERRAKFKANLWNRPNDTEAALSITDQQVQDPVPGDAKQPTVNGNGSHAHHTNSKKPTNRQMELRYSRDRNQPTDVQEVWFSGCHCDVGGGSVSNDTRHSLARIPLRWMIRECFRTNSGIMFDVEGLRQLGLDPDGLYPYVKPRPPALSGADLRIRAIEPTEAPSAHLENYATGESSLGPKVLSEEEEDLQDALSPVYDQLSLARFWWALEFLPIKQRYQRGNNTWASELGMNFGRGRFIPKQKAHGVKVHRSVKTRLEATMSDGKTKYASKAKFDLDRTTWMD